MLGKICWGCLTYAKYLGFTWVSKYSSFVALLLCASTWYSNGPYLSDRGYCPGSFEYKTCSDGC